MKTSHRDSMAGVILAALVCSTAVIPPSPCVAADTTWTAGSGNFTNPANWSAGVPDVNTNALFTSASSYTVSLTSDAISSNTYFNPTSGAVTLDLGVNTWWVPGQFWIGQNGGANSTVTMSGGTLVITNAAGTGDLTVGRFGLGAFSLNGGTVLSQSGAVGSTGNGNVIQVSGASTVWSNSGSFTLGYLGVNSRLVVTNDAQFNAGSGVFHIGYAGKTNSLIIADGGVVNSTEAWFSTAGGSGNNNALVTDPNSVWNNSSAILLGLNYGGNSLVVSNSGTVSSSILNVGYGSSTNTLTIHAESKVLATNVTISFGAGTHSNTILVAGGSLIVTNSTGGATLSVGYAGTGDLSLQGGLVKADKLTVLAGTLNNVGGTITAAVFNVSNGTVNTRDGSTTDVGSATLYIGNTSGQTGRWNVVSGTNTIRSASTRLSGDSSGIVGIMTVGGEGTFLNQIGGLEVGRSGYNALFVITNGARVDVSSSAAVGGVLGGGNTAIVTGSNSTWNLNNSLAMYLGYLGSQNQIVITNNGYVNASAGTFYIGYTGGGSNRLLIADGGRLDAAYVPFGTGGATSNNLILVSGTGSLLQAPSMSLSINSGAQANQIAVTNGGTARLGYLTVGENGSRNRADIGTGGTIIVTNALNIGYGSASASNLVMVSGGSLVITNSAGTARLVAGNAGEGTLTLNGGSVVVDQIFATNGVKSVVNLHAGTLTTRSTTVSNTTAFSVGDGIQAATLKLNGGSHLFANGLAVANNGTLAGTGTVNAVVSVANGGALAPGMSPGTLTINSNLTLNVSSLLNFELGSHDVNGIGTVGGGTNDLVVVNGDLILDGILNVTALPGWDTIVNTRTNVYRLFDYTGTLANNTLSFGLMPGDMNAAYIDTSVFGQVNLVVVIPEPSALALFAVAGAGLLVRRRKSGTSREAGCLNR